MKKAAFLLFVLTLLVLGCGGGDSNGGDEDDSDPGNPSGNNLVDPTLNPIGNKTVTVGQMLSFTISASDPNSLALTYATDGMAGANDDPYTETFSVASFNSDTRQFSWDTTGVALGDYFIEFSVENTDGFVDFEIIRIRVQNAPGQFELGQDLYNNNCTGCHKNEDNNTGGFSVLCTTEDVVRDVTNVGFGSMPPISLTFDEEAAIAFYLLNLRPEDC